METRLILFTLLLSAGGTTGVYAQEHSAPELSEFSLDLAQFPVIENRHYLSYNLLSIMTTPLNVGYEWRRDERFGLKTSLSGGFSPFVSLATMDETYSLGGRVEARWYQPDRPHPLYMGVGMGVYGIFANDDEYYDASGGVIIEDDRYNLTLFTPQLVLGYFHRTRHRISWDFNLGVGFIGWREKDDGYPAAVGGLIPIPLPVNLGISMTWETGRHPIRFRGRY